MIATPVAVTVAGSDTGKGLAPATARGMRAIPIRAIHARRRGRRIEHLRANLRSGSQTAAIFATELRDRNCYEAVNRLRKERVGLARSRTDYWRSDSRACQRAARIGVGIPWNQCGRDHGGSRTRRGGDALLCPVVGAQNAKTA